MWNDNIPHHMTQLSLSLSGCCFLFDVTPAYISTIRQNGNYMYEPEVCLFSSCWNMFCKNTERNDTFNLFSPVRKWRVQKGWRTELIFTWPFQHWKVGFKNTDRCERKTEWQSERERPRGRKRQSGPEEVNASCETLHTLKTNNPRGKSGRERVNSPWWWSLLGFFNTSNSLTVTFNGIFVSVDLREKLSL